jgi:DNA polymerase III gamma/tau subunit
VAPAVNELDRVSGRLVGQILSVLIEALSSGVLGHVLETLDAAFDSGSDASDILDQVCDVLGGAMERAARGLPGGGEGLRAPVIAKARDGFVLDRLMLAVRLCLNARREMKLAGLPRYQLEVTMLKVARSNDLIPLQQILSGSKRLDVAQQGTAERKPFRRSSPPAREVRPSGPEQKVDSGSLDEAKSLPELSKQSSASKALNQSPDTSEAVTNRSPAPLVLAIIISEWKKVIAHVKAAKPRIGSLIEPTRPKALNGNQLLILLPPGQSFHKKQLEGAAGLGPVEDAIEAILGAKLSVVYESPVALAKKVEAPERRVHDLPPVRKILDAFSGSVVRVDGGFESSAAPDATNTPMESEDTENEGL